ncbi:MAG: ABC transporter permease subunit [Actinomycetota bacterium]|nr:ABC transporter permease subunit [Actinomycetota bacterium]
MTTATVSTPTARAASRDSGPTEVRVLRSELRKMRTLRSTLLTLLVAVIGMAGLGLLISAVTGNNFNRMPADQIARFEPVGRSLGGVNIAQLAVGVLGVLLVTGEYGTGMIKSTMAAVPRRLPVLRAKALLYAVVVLVVMLPSAFIAFLGGQQLLGSHGTTLSSPHALRAVIGVALYLTVIGVLAVALGFIVRNTAGGIAVLFGVLLVLPTLGNVLPTSWQQNVLPYLPSRAGSALYNLQPDPGTLSPWTGFAVLCGWTVGALIAAGAILERRDV